MNLASAAASGFAEVYGAPPDGVWSAPGRVNLIGEHTDYNQGFVLPFAIDRRTHVALRARDDLDHPVVRVSSAQAAGVVSHDLRSVSRENVHGWSAYPLGTAWALGRAGAELGAFDAHVTSDVPSGAGLSSSAAIECALAVGLVDLFGASLDRRALVLATHRAENEIVGAPTGTLDQSASLLCEEGAALFLDCRDGTTESVPLGLVDTGLGVLVIDTRVSHAHADGGYASRRAACERGARELGVASLREVTDLSRAEAVLDDETFRRVRHVVTENQRVLDVVRALRAGEPAAIGPMLVASHASMRDDFEISVPELDTAVSASLVAGALGARMTGGGFGGSAIALVPGDRVAAVTGTVLDAFAAHGFDEPAIFEVTASEGARRER